MKMPSMRAERVTRPQQRPSAEVLRGVRSAIGHHTNLRVDLDRLSDDDLIELRALTREATVTDGDGVSDSPLNLDQAKQRRWEVLVARAADKPDNLFQTEREAARARREIREMAARAKRPPARIRYEQEGSVTLPAAVVRAYERHDLDAFCLLLLVHVILNTQVVGGPCEVSAKNPLREHDPSGEALPAWRALEPLVKAGWLKIERLGGQRVKVEYGPQLVKAFQAMEKERKEATK